MGDWDFKLDIEEGEFDVPEEDSSEGAEPSKHYLFDIAAHKKLFLFDGMIVGRSEKCDETINEKMVSNKHFKISIESDEVYIQDLNSSNESFLNGQPLTPEKLYKLSPKDVFLAGDYEFTFCARKKEDLALPDMSQSLRFESIDEMEQKDKIVGNDYQNQSRGDLFQRLKDSKKYLNELEGSKSEIDEKIKLREKLTQKHADTEIEKRCIEEKLKSSPHKKPEDIQKRTDDLKDDIEKMTNVMKSKKEEIEKLVEEINKEIKKNRSEVKQKKEEILDLREERKIHIQKENLSIEIDEMLGHIKELEELSLEEKKEYVDKEFSAESEKYKELQEDYGAALYSVNNKRKPAMKKKIAMGED